MDSFEIILRLRFIWYVDWIGIMGKGDELRVIVSFWIERLSGDI